MSKYSIFFLISGLIFTSLIFISYSTEGSIEEEEIIKSFDLPQVVRSVKLKDKYDWAGEVVPDNPDVMERLDRELLVNSYWHSTTLLHIKMANKFFPIMERILKEEGVPDDFKYLAVAESSLRNVSSHANAKGFWQFRNLAAKEWNLEVNNEVDERYNVEKSTKAAAQYLKQMKKRFGTWTDAAAAYNVGPTSYAKTLQNQGESNYYDLHLNDETSRYIFRLIAIKEIMSEPEKYGFYVDEEDLYPGLENTYEVKIDKSVASWKDFAQKHGISYRMLKYYNPWLIDNKLTVLNKTYYIRLPLQESLD